MRGWALGKHRKKTNNRFIEIKPWAKSIRFHIFSLKTTF